jgi:hypothetical protein
MLKANLRNSQSSLVRAAVWSLLAFIFVFASWSSPGTTPLAPGPIEITTIGEGLSDSVSQAATDDSNKATLSASTPVNSWIGSDKVSSLPAWRWNRIVLDADTSGWLGALKEIPVVVCTLLFLISQFIWSILLGLLKFAFDAGSLVAVAAPVINSGAAAIGRYILAFSILFWAIALWRVLRMLTRGNVAGALRSGGVFVILFALTFSMAITSANATKLDADQQVNVAGTLPWMATKVASFAGSVTGQLTLAEDLASKSNILADPQGVTPTCQAYISQIHSAYEAGNGNEAMLAMSKLWEQTQYRAWSAAMFGLPTTKIDLPGRSLCHYAESVNQVSATEQQLIASLAYPGIVPAPSSGRFLIFGPHNEKDLRKATIAWSACGWNGSNWQATPPWKGVWRESVNQDAMVRACGRAFSTGDKWESGTDDPFKVYGGSIKDAFDRGDVEHREALTVSRNFVEAFSGANISDRIFQSVLALLVSVLFLYVLGFIAIGMVAAQLMLILLLIFAPVTLAMYAMGSPKATSMLKLTGTAAVSQAFFGLILTALIVLSGIFQNLITAIPAAGFLKNLLIGMAPIAAFFAIRRLLQSIGMADIMKPSGAASFMASAALVATREKGEHGMMSKGMLGKDGRNEVMRKSRQAGNAATANALKGASATRAASRWSRGMATKDGRADRKLSKINQANARLEGRRNKIRDSYANRLDEGKQTRFSKLANWASERSLGDDRLSRTMLRAADAGDRLGKKADPRVQGAWKNLMSPGSNWYDQRLLPKPGEEKDVEIGERQFQDADSARSKGRLERSKMDAETRRDPSSAPALQAAMMSNTFANLAGNTFGDDFDGFATAPELAAAKLAAANAAGVGYHEIALSSNGVVMPMPGTMKREEMRNLPTDELRNFVYWLPEKDRMLEPDETPDNYVARMTAIGVARGLITSDGCSTDVFSKLGLDINNSDDRARIEAWQNGQKDDKLDKVQFKASDSAYERRLIEAARTSMARNQMMTVERQSRQQGAAYDSMRETATIQLPAATITTAANATVLDSSLSNYAVLLSKIDAAKARPDIDSNVLASLDKMRLESVKDIEHQFNATREALYTQVHDAVAVGIDASVALGKVQNDSQIADYVLSELEAFTNATNKLEEQLNGLWLGQGDVAKQLSDGLKSVLDDVNTYSASQIERAKQVTSSVSDEFAQHAATVRRGGSSKRAVSGRDLAKGFQALEFPR